MRLIKVTEVGVYGKPPKAVCRRQHISGSLQDGQLAMAPESQLSAPSGTQLPMCRGLGGWVKDLPSPASLGDPVECA